MVTINGKQVDCAGMTMLSYLQQEGYQLERIAVERNGEILPKKEYEHTLLQEDDTVEVVSFVGGG